MKTKLFSFAKNYNFSYSVFEYSGSFILCVQLIY